MFIIIIEKLWLFRNVPRRIDNCDDERSVRKRLRCECEIVLGLYCYPFFYLVLLRPVNENNCVLPVGCDNIIYVHIALNLLLIMSIKFWLTIVDTLGATRHTGEQRLNVIQNWKHQILFAFSHGAKHGDWRLLTFFLSRGCLHILVISQSLPTENRCLLNCNAHCLYFNCSLYVIVSPCARDISIVFIQNLHSSRSFMCPQKACFVLLSREARETQRERERSPNMHAHIDRPQSSILHAVEKNNSRAKSRHWKSDAHAKHEKNRYISINIIIVHFFQI